MGGQGARESAIATLADDQHGVVARSQLSMLGFTPREIDRRVQARRLNAVHRGVYAVGHRRLTIEGRWMAAVLAVGPDAALSHVSAAMAWDLRRTASGVIHVTVAGDGGRKPRNGLKVHRSASLRAEDVTTLRGIPITTAERTIVDLARTLSGRPLEHVIDLADQRGLVSFDRLQTAKPASLRAVLEGYSPAPTRSELEEAFLRLCDDHGLPRPETNGRVEGMEVDFVWRDRRLVVEVDGFAYHRAPAAFEDDRERDIALTLRGWTVLRFTWRQLRGRPAWVAAAIRSAP